MGQSTRSLCTAARCRSRRTSTVPSAQNDFPFKPQKKAPVITAAFNSGCSAPLSWPLTPRQITQRHGERTFYSHISLLPGGMESCLSLSSARVLNASTQPHVHSDCCYSHMLCWKAKFIGLNCFAENDTLCLTHTLSHTFKFTLLKPNPILTLCGHCPLILLLPRNLRALDFCRQNFVWVCICVCAESEVFMLLSTVINNNWALISRPAVLINNIHTFINLNYSQSMLLFIENPPNK